MKKTVLSMVAAGLITTASSFAANTVDFVRDVKPILEGACIHCHGPEKAEGKVRLDSKAAAFESNGDNPGVTPGDPDNSSIWWTTIIDPKDPDEGDLAMPPEKEGSLTNAQTEILKAWIEQGAEWPEQLVLVEQPRMNFKNHIEPLLRRGGPFNATELTQLRLWADQGAVWPEGHSIAGPEPEGAKDDMELVVQIRDMIMEVSTEKTESEMKAYTAAVPATGAEYSMVPIPGGEFLMGSPESEEGRYEDEGPQKKVKIEPFWMGKFEVTWDEYEPFMITDVARRKDGSPEKVPADADTAYVVSKPTTPYTEMSFGMGIHGYPCVSMTQLAAQKYCEWLSAQTGHFYRLPTEAEWEYACRAGTTTAFSWGDDPTMIDEYAWYYDNAEDKYQKVGLKKPNPWGLHDMHGNVLEWVMDKYDAEFYSTMQGDPVLMPYNKPGKDLYPRVARGGSWYDDPEYCRSATRFKSEGSWKIQDPQLPKSIWYHTDAEWLGFRLVRPLKTPPAAKMHEAWNSGKGEENE